MKIYFFNWYIWKTLYFKLPDLKLNKIKIKNFILYKFKLSCEDDIKSKSAPIQLQHTVVQLAGQPIDWSIMTLLQIQQCLINIYSFFI